MTMKKGPKAEDVSLRQIEDVAREWLSDPDFREAYRREVPYAEVARAIVDLRVRHGLSQSQFAQKVGRPQSYIARLESGKANVRIETLQSFAEAFGVALSVDFVQAAARASDSEKPAVGGRAARGTRGADTKPARSSSKRPAQKTSAGKRVAQRLRKTPEKTTVVA